MTLPGIRLYYAISLLAAAGCSPYDRYVGEVNAGAVDPSKFPKAYLGEDADPKQAGTGKFHPIKASVNGKQVAYYQFPLPAAQAAAMDPLLVSNLSPALAYLYNPLPTAEPYPGNGQYGCRIPEDRASRPANCSSDNTASDPYITPPDPCSPYVFRPRLDAFRYDVQNPIVTALPDSAGYVPIINEVPVTPKDVVCQAVKSEDTLLETPGVYVPVLPPAPGTFMGKSRGWPSGRYFAWAIIDPSAEVLTLDDKGEEVGESVPDKDHSFGPKRFGWWNKFMVAYLDGGLIPRQILADKGQVKLRAQRLFYPTTVVGPDGPTDGEPFVGYDVLEGARGSDAYSPLCQVFSYEPDDPAKPATSVADIKNLASIKDQKTLVYCLQLQ